MKRAITQRMEVVESDVQKLFTHLYCKRDFEIKLKEARRARPDRQVFVLRALADMIKDTGRECDYGRGVAYYSKIVSSLDVAEDADGINLRLVRALTKIYRDYPSPNDFMERIVYFLDPERAENDSLELCILKRLLGAVNVRENKKYYSRALSLKDVSEIDESVFALLREGRAKKSDTPPIVEAAYNLATGNFVSPVTTRELLFLFAFAYGMRYYPSTDAEDYEASRDVEKNLFEDYYCDNLTRYIYLEDGGKSGNSDKEPSGVGLNPKSFIDVIFIYYLNKEGISASERVSGFYNTVNAVKDAWNKSREYDESASAAFNSLLTKKYKADVDGIIGEMSEDCFRSYILENYYCEVRYTYVNKKTGETAEGMRGPFEFQAATNSAFKQYSEILDLIKSLLGLPSGTDLARLDRRTVKDVANGKAFDDQFFDKNDLVITRVSELEANALISNLDYFRTLDLDEEDAEDFISIIKNLEKRLDPYEVIGINDPLKVTRTKLIAAYFHYYCLENTIDTDVSEWKSLKNVFEDMSYCLNKYLDDAGYQKVSSKNLYDVFVIFLAYSKINGFFN